ncbi:MAG TPA: bifunctional salicylyl-CoA 5-hydroxylase/oxidoreductase [Herbaspirillum sp.]|jgi:anthraniloyl-CoA monooxygenase
MNIVCIGGGPAGLYFSLLMKQRYPAYRIVVIERNRAADPFGWGLVFSDRALDNLHRADEPTARSILQAFNHWDDIDTVFKGRTVRSGGHGFCGIARNRLLYILQARCEQLGVELLFDAEAGDDQAIARQYQADLVIAGDGLNSRIRNRYQDSYQPAIDLGKCRFIWLGTKKRFKAFTFAFVETRHGWFHAHIYQFDGDTSAFIIETPEAVWRRAGLDAMPQEEAIAYCEKLFADQLDGYSLLAGASAALSGPLPGAAGWSKFAHVVCRNWVHWNDVDGRQIPVVLMGDAAHSAHYSVGSGARLALEDAIELAHCFDVATEAGAPADLHPILARYQDVRGVEVLKMQNAARNSMEWFENVARYSNMDAAQFAYTLLTRSQRLSHENLRLRDAAYVGDYERCFAERAHEQVYEQAHAPAHMEASPNLQGIPPMFTPFRVRGLTLNNRIVVSPMAQYCAVDGEVGDYHLVHLGSRALGGAALVFAEMTCVSADARITPGCPGMYAPAHTEAWKRIVDFFHTGSTAKIGLQIGHAGPKGSTQIAWEGMDQPLPECNWPLIAASQQQYIPGVSQIARAMTAADMTRVQRNFVHATQQAALAGFDWLELHCAHGYLLSTFISPLTNCRTDDYGGSLENRCRYPLEIFTAIRAVWPQDKPISVRISAHDWVEGGITPDDAVQIARLFKQAGADMIDCSSGQVSKQEQPVYGRMYQTPFSDRIRNEAGIATIAVGAIYEADHANSIIAAGRADLCAIARPHLADPAWTLNQAARIGYGGADGGIVWPKQYSAAKSQLERNLARGKPGGTN